MNRRICSLIIPSLLAMAAPAFAHHGTAGSYDDNKKVMIEGTVKEFRWRNPHSALFLIAKDPAGKEVTYAIELGSPNVLARAGLVRTSIKAGDKVRMEMHPSLTNPLNGYTLGGTQAFVNGRPLNLSIRRDQP